MCYSPLTDSFIRRTRTYRNIARLNIPKLDLDSVRIDGYGDAFLTNNNDLTYQLRRIVPLVDDEDSAVPICFKSCK